MSKNQEILMETTHGRKSNCKTEFKAVLSKVLVSGLVLATIIGSVTPAYAASVDNSALSNGNANTITSEYGISLAETISSIKNTISFINENRANGSITDEKLLELSVQINNLERVVQSSGNEVTNDVVSVINEAEKIASQFDSKNAQKAQVAVSIVKANLGIGDTVSVSNKEAAQAEKVTSFSDVSSSHWAYKNIMTMVNKGVISGVSTPVNGVGKYDPTGTVTLGQFLAISTRLVANDKIVKGDYSHWATANYNAAIQANLIRSSDFEGSPLALNANLSREDMAYILVNIAKANGEDLKIKDGIQNNIKDYNSISPNRQNVVLQAYSNGLLAGDTQGKFNPHQVLNRAEVAAVFCRVMNYSARPEVKVNQPSENVSTGYVVTTAGELQGMLKPEYSRQFDLEALQGVRTGSDSKGVYVTFTAPQLPNELKNNFSFKFVADGYKSNGNYLDANKISVTLKSGETKKVYFESNNGGITSSSIGSMYVSVGVCNNSQETMMRHRVDSTDKTKALEQWYDGDSKVVDFNSSAIFSGIGK